MREGSSGDSMYFVLSGQLQVLKETQANEQGYYVALLGPGDVVGEMGPLLGQERSATVRVSLQADLLELRKEALDQLFRDYPEIAISFSRELARELARRLTRTTERPKQRDEHNLVAALGKEIPLLASQLSRVTGERVLLLDVGGLQGYHGPIPDNIEVLSLDEERFTDSLAVYLSQIMLKHGRVVMALPHHETALTRQAAEQAEIVVELGGRTTPWIQRFARTNNYWYYPEANGTVSSIARRIARRRVGLALSSGNARSIAHIGVLKVLAEAEIPIDVVAGTSGGGLFGGLYAIGKPLKDIAHFARGLGKYFNPTSSLVDFDLWRRTGIVKGERVHQFLRRTFEELSFEDAMIPLRVVAADVISGAEIVLNSGPIADAVRATISSVPLFAPAHVNGQWLIDGAAVNPVPASVLRDEVDIIIASSVIVSLEERQHRRSIRLTGKLPNALQLMIGKEEIMEAGIVRDKMGHVDALIQPDVTILNGLDFDRTAEFIEAGIAAAEQMLPAINHALSPTPQL